MYDSKTLRLRPGVKRHSQRRPAVRSGVTIVEMMIAMLISLLLVMAVLQGFQVIAQTITESRALLEMSGRLRGALHQIQEDLEGLTVAANPPISTASSPGYLEIFEGARTDRDSDGNGIIDAHEPTVDSSRGDSDDILMLTTERRDEPFLGRVPRLDLTTGNLYTSHESSPTAEVAYWTSFDDRNANGVLDLNEHFLLHRRVLLIRPDLNNSTTGLVDATIFAPVANPVAAFQALRAFQQTYDVSARVEVSRTSAAQYGIACNSLADLTRRGSRFAHLLGSYPGAMNVNSYPFWRTSPIDLVDSANVLQGSRLEGAYQLAGTYSGEDVALSSALAVDIRVFDPNAQIRALPGLDYGWGVAGVDDNGVAGADDVGEAGYGDDEAVTPGDPGYANGVAMGLGAYVDMNYMWRGYGSPPPLPGVFAPISGSVFSGTPVFADLNSNGILDGVDYFPGVIPRYPGQFAYYDTWCDHYESDGYDQDAGLRPSNPGADQGTNGLDDDGVNGVDDAGERETSPPYPTRLRGIQVRIRMIDPDTRQIRQNSVEISFVK